MSVRIAIAYHSGYGHTARIAQAVAQGVREAGAEATVILVSEMQEGAWEVLDAADGILFGAPTYMGGVSAQFKAFIDSASRRWLNQVWKDKTAGGFTNSGAFSGDKLSSLMQLVINAMQHSMIWIGTGMMPASVKGVEGPDSTQVNRMGSALGVMAQSNNEPPELVPPSGDLETARLYGVRFADITRQMQRGKRAA